MLEIGAGSGYQTAVLARLAGQVYAIERIAELAREAQARIRSLGIYNATVKCFDGTLGWSAHAPYDGILVAAGGPEVPDPLLAQLKVGGRLVVPVGPSRESQQPRPRRPHRGRLRARRPRRLRLRPAHRSLRVESRTVNSEPEAERLEVWLYRFTASRFTASSLVTLHGLHGFYHGINLRTSASTQRAS